MIMTKDGEKRFLRADEIECRRGQNGKDGKRYAVLLYKTARTDMEILDEVFGSENWSSEHYEVKGKDFCRIGVRFGESWVYKSDCGSESNTEAEKGESSDAFKRAGVQWGIGRELYTAPKIWVDSTIPEWSLRIKQIGYDTETNAISDLELTGKVGDKWETVFTLASGKTGGTAKSKKADDDRNYKAGLISRIKELGGDVDRICMHYAVGHLEELDTATLEKIVNKGEQNGK